MLPLQEKVLEKFIGRQLQDYLEKNNILIEEQSGFRGGHSCETALVWLLNEWKRSIDKKEMVLAVFLDFKRAFETIDREILLKKLFKYGIKGKELEWFKSYLSGRTQRTRVNNELSNPINIELGVPQGAVLGVILFLIYINDIHLTLKHCKVALFADDTLLYITGKDISDLENKMKEDLEALSKWLDINKLKLNINKTKAMIFNSNQNVNLSMNCEDIEVVEKIKYLGVIIDKSLNFKEHADSICGKIAKKVGFLRRIRSQLTMKSAKMMYNTLILPHFDYCSGIFFCANQNIRSRLQILQNKGMRMILKCESRTPVAAMLRRLNWFSVEQRLTYNVLLFIFKIKMNILPNYLRRHLQYVSEGMPYALRSASNFRLQKYNLTSTQNSVMYKGLKLYNELPIGIKNESNLGLFRKKVIEFLKIE